MRHRLDDLWVRIMLPVVANGHYYSTQPLYASVYPLIEQYFSHQEKAVAQVNHSDVCRQRDIATLLSDITSSVHLLKEGINFLS